MPRRISTITTEPPTPLRRSPRFLSAPKTPDPKTPKPRSNKELSLKPSPSSKRAQDTHIRRKAEVSRKPSEKSRNCGNLGSGSAKYPELCDGFEGFQNRRRSSRIVNQRKAKDRAETTSEDGSFSKRVSSSRKAVPVEVSKKSSNGSRNFEILSDNEVNGVEVPRRSSRVSKLQKPNGRVKKTDEEHASQKCKSNGVLSDIGNIINCVSGKSTRKKVLSDARKVEVGKNLCEQYEEVRVEGAVCSNVVNPELVREEKEREGNGVKRKRKRDEDCNGGSQGWTDEQEKALQRAYFASQPTPHFWKKVAKMVRGKSAQECFDKIYSNHQTPPQPPPRSRTKKSDPSSADCFSLSASKLLLSPKMNGKRPISSKRKSHVAQKTVRQMLQKHYQVEENYEADLFSVLEPNIDPSVHAVKPSATQSTPEHLLKKQGFLQKYWDKSSSGRKKAISRFSDSCGNVLVSPPVLKQVKNRALHEKYIDQLHCREAKRKAASARAEKFFTGKENPKECRVQKVDVVRAAKAALVCEARNAISQLQHLQANAMNNSCDFGEDENGSFSNDADEVEDEF